jgi:hypothetical protein
MTRQACVRLFQIIIEPDADTFEGWRNISDPESYRLSVAGQPDWFVTPQTAARLGRCARLSALVCNGPAHTAKP